MNDAELNKWLSKKTGLWKYPHCEHRYDHDFVNDPAAMVMLLDWFAGQLFSMKYRFIDKYKHVIKDKYKKDMPDALWHFMFFADRPRAVAMAAYEALKEREA